MNGPHGCRKIQFKAAGQGEPVHQRNCDTRMNQIITFVIWKEAAAMVVFMAQPDGSAEEQVMKFLIEQEGNA